MLIPQNETVGLRAWHPLVFNDRLSQKDLHKKRQWKTPHLRVVNQSARFIHRAALVLPDLEMPVP